MSPAYSGTVGRVSISDEVRARLRAVFVTEARLRLDRLSAAALGLLAGSRLAGRAAVGDLHAIAGSAPVIEETRLASSAKACEALLTAFDEAPEIPDPVLAEVGFLLDDVIARLSEVVRAA